MRRRVVRRPRRALAAVDARKAERARADLEACARRARSLPARARLLRRRRRLGRPHRPPQPALHRDASSASTPGTTPTATPAPQAPTRSPPTAPTASTGTGRRRDHVSRRAGNRDRRASRVTFTFLQALTTKRWLVRELISRKREGRGRGDAELGVRDVGGPSSSISSLTKPTMP